MMSENLIIVFVKNAVLGKVKTRLARAIGDQAAFEIYERLVGITERETEQISDCTLHIYFSDFIEEESWSTHEKFIQSGVDLGERMKKAFQHGFDSGYERIIGVGSDLPDLTAEIMLEGIAALTAHDTVFGPSEDGGYYLIGMNQLIPCIFENKAWSTDSLLNITKAELTKEGFSIKLLNELNDVDTLEDLRRSTIEGGTNF